MRSLELVLREASKDIDTLLANWRADEKAKLGISNQDYPEERDAAANRLVFAALKAEIAEAVLLDPRFLYHSAARAHYAKLVKAALGREILTSSLLTPLKNGGLR